MVDARYHGANVLRVSRGFARKGLRVKSRVNTLAALVHPQFMVNPYCQNVLSSLFWMSAKPFASDEHATSTPNKTAQRPVGPVQGASQDERSTAQQEAMWGSLFELRERASSVWRFFHQSLRREDDCTRGKGWEMRLPALSSCCCANDYHSGQHH